MDLYGWYAFERKMYLHHVPVLPHLVKGVIRVLWGGVVPYQCEIGEGTCLAYQACGTVIHKEAVIGRDCHIAQNVTIGGTSGKKGVPRIGDRVFVGAGAAVLGPIEIGDEVTIGAGAVVTKSVPSNCVVVGVPGRVVKENVEPYSGLGEK